MAKKLKKGELYGTRKVLEFVSKIKHIEYYKVVCITCNEICTIRRDSLLKMQVCRKCNCKRTMYTYEEKRRNGPSSING